MKGRPEHDRIVNAYIRRELGMALDDEGRHRSIHTQGLGEAESIHAQGCPCCTCADTMAKRPQEAA